MKEAIRYGVFLTAYTLVYHGLYYCPPIYKGFSHLIKCAHWRRA